MDDEERKKFQRNKEGLMKVYEELKAQRGLPVNLKEPNKSTLTYSNINSMNYQSLHQSLGGGGEIFKPSDILDLEEEAKEDENLDEAMVNYEEA